MKTQKSHRAFHICNSMLQTLKVWKQTTQFLGPEDWMFASPAQLGRLSWSYDQIWRVYQKAADKAGIGGLGTHSLRTRTDHGSIRLALWSACSRS